MTHHFANVLVKWQTSARLVLYFHFHEKSIEKWELMRFLDFLR